MSLSSEHPMTHRDTRRVVQSRRGAGPDLDSARRAARAHSDPEGARREGTGTASVVVDPGWLDADLPPGFLLARRPRLPARPHALLRARGGHHFAGASSARLALMIRARASMPCATTALFVLRRKPAKFSRTGATSGCSGPSAFSRIASARRYRGSACKYFPWAS